MRKLKLDVTEPTKEINGAARAVTQKTEEAVCLWKGEREYHGEGFWSTLWENGFREWEREPPYLIFKSSPEVMWLFLFLFFKGKRWKREKEETWISYLQDASWTRNRVMCPDQESNIWPSGA